MPAYRLRSYRGKFAVVWYDGAGKRHRQSLGTNDRPTAERAIAALNLKDALDGQITVGRLWANYCSDNLHKSITTTMRYTWKALEPVFGHLAPDMISIDLSRKYTALRRKQGRSDGTIWTELGHLRSVFNWAYKRQLIDRVPHIELPKKPPPKTRYLTRDEAHRLLTAARLPHIKLAIILMLGTAARVSAILELTWERCDFDRGLIYLHDPDAKSQQKGRAIVPMTKTVRSALLVNKQGALTDNVIEWSKKPVRSIKRSLGQAAERAQLEGISAHVLRHTAAVWMAEGGIPMSQIAQYLGHSNTTITERVYARYSPDFLRVAADTLELDLHNMSLGESAV